MTSDTNSMPDIVGAAAVLVKAREQVEADDRWVRRRVGLAWGMLILNTLVFFPTTYSGLPLVLPIPSTIGKAITQVALPIALVLAWTVNRRMAVCPNAFLILVSLLVLEAVLTSTYVSQISNAYRTLRFAEFVVTLWLLSPWWGRRDLLLVRCHLVSMYLVLGSVALGVLASPRKALAQGRLEGAFWPTPPTQVAEFAAVTLGLVVILWLGAMISGRATLLLVLSAGSILLLTHTRTALVALITGISVAGLSLFVTNIRVRNLFGGAGVAAFIGILTMSSTLRNWWSRGETAAELSDLTGRSRVWAGVLTLPRDQYQMIFGSGLGSQGFNGLPIDDSWLVAYNEQGLIAAVVCAAMLLFLFATACFRARGTQRALALFLVTYCGVTSFTESGLSSPSTLLLYLALAASLLVRPFAGSRPS